MQAYAPVAHLFADLRDRPGRMMAAGAIRGVIPWKDARRVLYWRLRRRMAEFAVCGRLQRAAPQLSPAQSRDMLKGWFATAAGAGVGQ